MPELTDEIKAEIVRQIIAGCDKAWSEGIDCGRPSLVRVDGELVYSDPLAARRLVSQTDPAA